MISEFAPAKVNLALHVLGRREDGYHELDSIVAFADVGDRLSVTAASAFAIDATGPFAAGLPDPAGNIIRRAWEAAAARWPVPPVAVNLEKNLPVAAGIGGGSANAAAMLRALMRLNGLSPPVGELHGIALALGADVPVCLASRACRMQGIGERLSPLAGFAPLHAVLANPGVAAPTADIFRAMGIARGNTHGAAIAEGSGLRSWRNDMADAAVSVAPAIADVLAALAGQPELVAARMSGSGATCYGVFETATAAARAAAVIGAAHPGWWVVSTRLS